jgi:hypothetical protein
MLQLPVLNRVACLTEVDRMRLLGASFMSDTNSGRTLMILTSSIFMPFGWIRSTDGIGIQGRFPLITVSRLVTGHY